MNAVANDNRTLRQALEASLAAVPSKPSPLAISMGLRSVNDCGKPARYIEPSNSREDAILEATRIARDPENWFGTGFAWLAMGHWYAADTRPGLTGGVGEILCVDAEGAVSSPLLVERGY